MDIVQAMRAQLLGQFLDTVGAAAATGPAASPARLTPGQTLAATMLGEIAEGKVAVRIAGQAVAADASAARLPPEARRPGATLTLRVETAGPTPRLSLVGVQPPPAAGARDLEIQPRTQPLSRLAPETAELRLQPAPAQPAAAAAAPRPAAPLPQAPLQTALKEAVAAAAAKQGSAAPLYATLAAIAARPDAQLPEPVRQIASLLLAGRIDAERPVTPQIVRQAFAAAGAAAPPSDDATPPPDVKALLATLKTLLPRPDSDSPSLTRADAPPEPPRRDAGPAPHRPVPPALPADAEPRIVLAALRQEAGQALERAKLHAYAAIPEQRAGAADAPRPQHLQFELPVAFGPQTAMMGVRVEHERRKRRETGEAVDVWGIRFAIETDEIGAVHAHLRLSGRTLNVSLWADDDATHRAFVESAPMLEAALRDAALEVGEMAIFSGAPQEARKAGSGRFLDVSS